MEGIDADADGRNTGEEMNERREEVDIDERANMKSNDQTKDRRGQMRDNKNNKNNTNVMNNDNNVMTVATILRVTASSRYPALCHVVASSSHLPSPEISCQ